MSKRNTLKQIEKRAFALRITMTDLRRKAKVSPQTMAAWKADPERLTARTVVKLESALAEMEAGK